MIRYALKLFAVFFAAQLCITGRVLPQAKPLTIDDCVQIALKNNSTILMKAFNEAMAGKGVTSAFSSLLPSIHTSIGYSHSVLGPSSATRIDPETGIPVPLQPTEIHSYSYRSSISASYMVFNGGYNMFSYRRSRCTHDASEHDLELSRQDIICTVKERYYNLLKSRKLLEVAGETLRSSEESYKKSQALFEVGKAPRSDILKAKVQMEKDRHAMIRAQNDLGIARSSLNHIMGFRVDREFTIVDNLRTEEKVIEYSSALENAILHHPRLKREQANVKAAKAGVGMAISRFMLKFNVYGGYNWRHEEFSRIGKMFDKDYNWYAGATVSLPIFQGFFRISETGKAKLARKYASEALKLAEMDVALEVRQRIFEVNQAKKLIAVSQEGMRAAEEDLLLNKEKYDLGAGTMLDLINAQVSYASSQSDYFQALYDHKTAVAKLERAMGILHN